MNVNPSMAACPISASGSCHYLDDLPTSPFTSKTVFFAYDTANPNAEPLRHRLTELLAAQRLELVTFEDSRPAAAYYFCENICKQIRRCALVVADIGKWDTTASRYHANPNVTLEVGLALGLGKKVLLVTSHGVTHTPENIPSDFYGMQIYSYPKDFFRDNSTFEAALRQIVQSRLAYDSVTLVSDPGEYRRITLLVNSLDGNRFGIHKRLPTIVLSERAEMERLRTKYQEDSPLFCEHLAYWRQRKLAWEAKKSGNYKTRAIFDQSAVETQILENTGYGCNFTPATRRGFLDEFIEYLNRADYEVAMTPHDVHTTFTVVQDQTVWLYTVGSFRSNSTLSGMLLTNRGSVRSFTDLFSATWEAVFRHDPQLCSKLHLIGWMKSLKRRIK